MSKVIKYAECGVNVTKLFDDSGDLRTEGRVWNDRIVYSLRRKKDGTWEETYLVDAKLVGADAYDEAVRGCAGMPSANRQLDLYGLAVTALGNEDTSSKEQDDLSGLVDESVEYDSAWRKVCFGELGFDESLQFLDRIKTHNARQLRALDVEHDNGLTLIGGLLVELPTESNDRSEILGLADAINEKSGYDGVADHGQRYAYFKFG